MARPAYPDATGIVSRSTLPTAKGSPKKVASSPACRRMACCRRRSNFPIIPGSSACSFIPSSNRGLSTLTHCSRVLSPRRWSNRGWCEYFDLSPSAIGRHALIGHPGAGGHLSCRPKDIYRHAPARKPIAADSQPARLQAKGEILADPQGEILVESPVLAKRREVEF